MRSHPNASDAEESLRLVTQPLGQWPQPLRSRAREAHHLALRRPLAAR